jgi:hypothetical protein
MKRCKKLNELPTVATDWKQTTWCPDCEHYHGGCCDDPKRTTASGPCAFDGRELPIREVEIEVDGNMSTNCPPAPLSTNTETNTWRMDLEEEIRLKILERTWGRIQLRKIEANGNTIVISGRAPCYYLKQLAIQAALGAVDPDEPRKVEVNLDVEGYQGGPEIPLDASPEPFTTHEE